MLRCAGLFTGEADDPGLALEQILAQLAEKVELLENTVGVIMCHTEFLDSEVLQHVAAGLPFDVAGVTTSGLAVSGMRGEIALTVFVMTSDTIRFRAGISDSVEGGVEAPLREAVERVKEPGQPGLVLAFPPLMAKRSGDEIAEIWGKIFPGAPVFGSLAVDDSSNFMRGSRTIFGSETTAHGHAFILCYGDISPRFLIATLPEENRLPHKGEITRSEANVVFEIDGRKAGDYFSDIGFAGRGEGGELGIFWFVPFMISQRKRRDFDGVPVVRGLMDITEDGAAIFRGNIDEGSVFTLLKMTAEDVVSETEAKLSAVRDMPDVNGALIFSCVVRHMRLIHGNPLAELESGQKALGSAPFMMCYAGGEYCPTSVRDGAHVNRFHNYSLVALIL